MIKKILPAIPVVLIFYLGPAHACMTVVEPSCISSIQTLINFNNGSSLGLNSGDQVTNQWSNMGVTFGGGVMEWEQDTVFGTPALYGGVDTGSIGSIYFAKDVNSVSFQFYTLKAISDSIIIQAKNNGVVVDTITIPEAGNMNNSNLWYSFAGNTYDEIHIQGSSLYWNLDDLEFSSVPIPGTFLLLGTGIIGLIGLRRKFGF